MKPTKREKELKKLLKEYQSIQLDLEAAMSSSNPAKHKLEIDYNVARLETNNIRFDILVSGSGTGDK